MPANQKRQTGLARLLADKNGNFGMFTALLLPVGIFFTGVVMDTITAMELKHNMQSTADAAALAGVSAMISKTKNYTIASAEAEAETLMVGQLAQSLANSGDKALKKTLTDNSSVTISSPETGVFVATAKASFKMPVNAFTRLIAGNSLTLSVSSSTTATKESKAGLSMYLVLDRSGSMSFVTEEVKSTTVPCQNFTSSNWGSHSITDTKSKSYIKPVTPCYLRKIEALQNAAASLFQSFNTADTTSERVRTGAIAYSDKTYSSTGMNWGTAAAATYVSNFPYLVEGGTDSKGAMKIAFEALKKSNGTEKAEHDKKKNTHFNRYIVLMTDGEMTGSSSAWNSTLDQETRNYCRDAKADGIVIFSVAFMAPEKGKALLSYCASSPSHYYQTANMAALSVAFSDIANKAIQATVRLTN